FQAEDGIRDRNVTGVQTCALPILAAALMYSGTETDPRRMLGEALIDSRVLAHEALRDACAASHNGGVLPTEVSRLDAELFPGAEIRRASCRERGGRRGGRGSVAGE